MFNSSESLPNQNLELVFLDRSVNGYEGLLTELENNSQNSIIAVTLEENAIAQITETLKQYQGKDISGIHIISHGQEGSIQLGNINLNQDNLSSYTDELTAWGDSLTENGDILFYGCNVAQGQIGQEFVHSLSKITDADISASDDLTGNKNLNGDWILEYNTGDIETETLTFNSFNDTLALSLATIQAAAGNLANLDLADFIDLIGNFTGNADNTVFTGSGISGFIGKDANTPDKSDDVGLNISNATITLTKQEGVNNYTYSITGANVELIGVDFVDLQGTFSLTGGIVDNSVTSVTLNSSNTILFAGSGTDTTDTNDDKGVKISNGITKILISDDGVAYEVSGIGSLVGLSGLTLGGSIKAQGNNTGSTVNLNGNNITNDTNQVSGNGLNLGISGLVNLTGDLTFEFRDTSPSFLAVGENLTATVNIGDVSGSVNDGELALIWKENGTYALQGSGSASLSYDGLTLTGDLGFEVNKTGEKIDETVNGKIIKFDSISDVVQFDASNLDVILNQDLKTAFLGVADSIEEIRADLFPQFDQNGVQTNAGSIFTENIPGTNTSLDNLLGVSGYLSLGQNIRDYLDNNSGATLQGLINYLNNNWSSDLPIPFDLDFVINSGGFDFSFAADYSLNKSINVGLPENNLGLVDLEGNANINVAVNAGIDFDLSVDFAEIGNAGADFADNFVLNRFDFDASATANDIVLGAYLGPLGLSLGSNEVGKQKATLALNLDGSIDYNASNGFSFDSNLASNQDVINVVLPIYASIAGNNIGGSATPTVTIEGNPFIADGIDITTANFDELLSFKNFSVLDVLYTLQGLLTWAQDFRSYDVMSEEIPLLNKTLGDALDFAKGINDQILNAINFFKTDNINGSGGTLSTGENPTFVDGDGGFTNALIGKYITISTSDNRTITAPITGVNNSQTLVLDANIPNSVTVSEYIIHRTKTPFVRTIDELIDAINDAEVLPNGVSIDYDPNTNEFFIPLEFAQSLAPLQNTPLDFGLDLGDLSLSTNAKANLQASVNGSFELIIDFDGETGTEGLSFFVDNVFLGGDLDFNVNNLTVNAQLGFLGLTAGNANSGALLNAEASIALKDGSQTRFNINELFDSELLDKFALDFTGNAQAKLQGLSVNGGFGNLNIAPSAELGLYLPDLTNPIGLQVINQDVNTPFDLQDAIASNQVNGEGVIVVLPDVAEILSLRELSFADVIAGVRAGIDFLGDQLADNPFYNAEIPVINISLAETFTFLDDLGGLLENAANNPVGVLQDVESAIESALGLNDNNSLPAQDQLFALSLTDNNTNLNIHLGWQKLLSENYSFALDLDTIKALSGNTGAAALEAISTFADLGASGNILLEAIADLNFDIAINLASLKNGTPEIDLVEYDEATQTGTFAQLGVRVKGSPLDLNFRLGPVEIAVVDGLVLLDRDGNVNTNDYAGLLVALGANNTVDFDIDGNFNINLPIILNALGFDVPLDDINISLANGKTLADLFNGLQNGGGNPLSFTFPDIKGAINDLNLDFSLLSIINDPGFILDGVDLAVGGLENVLDSNLAQDLPLIGDKLASAATFLRDIRQGLLADLRTKLSGNGKALEVLQSTLFDVLGTKLGLLDDFNNDGFVNQNDIQIGWYAANGDFIETWEVGDALPTGADAIEFNMLLGGSLYATGIDFPLNFDVPGFSLNADGGFGLDIGWSFDFGFGLSLTDGFYLATNSNNDPELELDISAFLDNLPKDPNNYQIFTANGQLLFLDADIKDINNTINNRASGLYGQLALNITGNSNGRLNLDRILGGKISEIFDVDLSLDAELNLETTLSLAGTSGLPRLKGDLNFDWAWQLGQPLTSPGFDLNNFAVDLGSYVNGFLKPIAEKINDMIEPIEPLIDAFTTTIPGLDKIMPDGYTPDLRGLIDALLVLKGRKRIDWTFFDEANKMLDLVGIIANMPDDENWLLLGNMTGLGTSTPSTNTNGINLQDIENRIGSLQQTFTDNGIRQNTVTSGSRSTPRSGFQVFPYLKDISNWMNLLTGGDATLFTYELPLLEFGADFRVLLATYGIPNVVSLDITAIAGFSVFADLGFGYDTFGIRQAINTGNPLYALDGFYLMDWNLQGNEKPEFGLDGYVGLEASVNLAVARGGIDGRLTLEADVDINDIKKPILTKNNQGYVIDATLVGDGKIRGSEIVTMVDYGIFLGANTLFNLSVALGLEVNVFADIFALVKWENVLREKIVDITLWEKQFPAVNVEPILIDKNGNIAYLNSGNRANERRFGNKTDGAETFIFYTDYNNNSLTGVEFDGYYQTKDVKDNENLNNLNQIIADGGSGNDVFDASLVTNAGIELIFNGGVGDDEFTSGKGKATFSGGIGNDILDASRSIQNSSLQGDAGDDELVGGIGDDYLSGGDGEDDLVGGKGNDSLAGGKGADKLEGGEGNDTYIFENDFNIDRVTDNLGSNTFDFSAVTQDLEVVINARGITVYYVSPDGTVNEVKGGSSIRTLILGSGNDNVIISDFGEGEFTIIDTDGSDTYRFALDRATGSRPMGTINLIDNSGDFDEIILEQNNLSSPINLNNSNYSYSAQPAYGFNQVNNGREVINYNYTSGVERLTILGKAGQFNGDEILNFGGKVIIGNSNNNGLSNLNSTDLRIIAQEVDFQSNIQSDAIIVETLNTISVDRTLNALTDGYIDLRTFGDDTNINLSANLTAQGDGWIRLISPDGAIINDNGSQIIAPNSHLIIKAKDGIGSISNPLLTTVEELTAITATHGEGDIVIQETDSLTLTNLEKTASANNGGFILPSQLTNIPSWMTNLSTAWGNALKDGNESTAIASGNGDIYLTLTGNNALLTLASGSLINQQGGNIELIAGDFEFNSGNNQIQGTSNLLIKDYQNNLIYQLGSEAEDGINNNRLDLSQKDLSALQNGFTQVTIGQLGVGNSLIIGDILNNAAFKDVTLLLGNNIQVTGDARGTDSALTLNTNGNITFTNTGKLTTDAIITLLADVDNNGSGGIDMADGAIINAINHNIDLDATENIILGLLTTNANVTVDSVNGSILDADTNGNLDIIANTAILQAINGGIGTNNNPLETQLSYLEADAGNGGIWVDNIGDLIVGEISGKEGLNALGEIKVTTEGSLDVKENVISQANITLQTIDANLGETRNIPLDKVGLDDFDIADVGEYLTVIGGVTVNGDNINLLSGDDLELQANSEVIASNNITIEGDYGNQDAGKGTVIDLDGIIIAENVLIKGNTDNDVINIHVQQLVGNTLVQGNNGNDLIIVDELPSLDIEKRGDSNRNSLTLDGQQGDDQYLIYITEEEVDYRINVFDTGDNGQDEMTVFGLDSSTSPDEFLLRASAEEFNNGGVAFVASLQGDTDGNPNTLVERINYNRNVELLIVEAREGNDNITLDDNWTETIIRGGEGEDNFQVGQIFKSERDAQAGLDPQDVFNTRQSTRGFLSNGVSSLTTIEGGDGNDTFTVFSNLAALDLQGQDGDDLFIIRSFASEGSFTSEVDTGEGSDTVEYLVNAPVNVSGGGGTDTLRVIGTEFADKFIVTESAIFGAGRTITYDGIEIVEIDAAEGKDEFYVLSTSESVVTKLYGGLGSDYFSLGGDTAEVQAGVPTEDDFFTFDFIEEDGKILPQFGSHTVNLIKGELIIDGFGGEGSAGGLGEPVLLPGETNILPSDGEVIGFSGTGEGGAIDSMVVATSDLALLGELVGKTLEISQGNGLRRFWRIIALVDNGDGTTTLSLQNPTQPASEWTLPDENSEYAITSLSANFFVDENTTEDRVTVFEDGDTTDNSGTLSENLLTGFGLGVKGVTYGNFEIVELLLGQGNDNLTITNTADGAITSVHGGGGNDTIIALDRGGVDSRGLQASLVIFGDTSEDGDRYSSTPDEVKAGFANGFTNTGNDVIDASAMVEIVSIYGGDGNDTMIGSQTGDHLAGGSGDDSIAGLGGDDHIYGDSGLNVDLSSRLLTVPTTDDTGNDIIDGGEGDNIIFGDHGIITQTEDTARILTTGNVIKIETVEVNRGGNDQIIAGSGGDRIFGGQGNDTVNGGDGDNIILGDNGEILYEPTLSKITSTNPTQGGDDNIITGSGNDMIIAGTGDDEVKSGAGNDLIFGDHGLIEGNIDAELLPLATLTPAFTFTAIDTQNEDLGGNDTIEGEAGEDIILGQQGDDIIRGGNGDDDIIGGHNVVGGHDGSDRIDGGSENDVIAGDNAIILRRGDTLNPRTRLLTSTTIYDENGNPLIGDDAQLNPRNVAERTIILLDHSDNPTPNTYGNDYIAGGANDDVIFGQLGDDIIQGDASIDEDTSDNQSVENLTDGDDYIEGNGGSDHIFGNLGQDDIIGGSSDKFGLTTPSQRPDGLDTIFGGAGTRIERNHVGEESPEGNALDADVILGDNGNIYRLVNTQGEFLQFTYDSYSGILSIIPRAFALLDYTEGGASTDIGADDLLYGESGDDIIHGMKGNDVIFGDGENDDLYGGTGGDRIYGGTGIDGIIGDDGKIYTSRNGETEILNGLTTPNVETTISLPGPFVGAVIYITGELWKTVKLTAWESGGNDIIYGGLDDDFIHGGQGDDAISGAEALPEFYNSNPQINLNVLGYDPVTGKFALYDAIDPFRKIDGFLLNFEAFDSQGQKINDGQDHIFGDLGNDWLVGGTENDRIFGGLGDDLINVDDNLETNNGLNNRPDDPEYADADFAFGGGGLDVMIANTGGDRLFDWGGEFNTYLVPFNPYGLPTIHREPSPGAIDFILALGMASGADQSRIEPDGELGLVRQKDPQWQDNHGGPRDANVRTGSSRDTQGSPESNTASTNTTTLSQPTTFSEPVQSAINSEASSTQLLTTNDISKTVKGGNNQTIALTTTNNNQNLSSSGWEIDLSKGNLKGFVLNYQNSNNYQYVAIDSNTGNVVIAEYNKKGTTILASSPISKLSQLNKLGIKIEGNQLIVTIDGQIVLTHLSTTYDAISDLKPNLLT